MADDDEDLHIPRVEFERQRFGDTKEPISPDELILLDGISDLLHFDVKSHSGWQCKLSLHREETLKTVLELSFPWKDLAWHCDGKTLFLNDNDRHGHMITYTNGSFKEESVSLPSNAYSFLKSNDSIYFVIKNDDSDDLHLVLDGSTEPVLSFHRDSQYSFFGRLFVVLSKNPDLTTKLTIYALKDGVRKFVREKIIPFEMLRFTKLANRSVVVVGQSGNVSIDCFTMRETSLAIDKLDSIFASRMRSSSLELYFTEQYRDAKVVIYKATISTDYIIGNSTIMNHENADMPLIEFDRIHSAESGDRDAYGVLLILHGYADLLYLNIEDGKCTLSVNRGSTRETVFNTSMQLNTVYLHCDGRTLCLSDGIDRKMITYDNGSFKIDSVSQPKDAINVLRYHGSTYFLMRQSLPGYYNLVSADTSEVALSFPSQFDKGNQCLTVGRFFVILYENGDLTTINIYILNGGSHELAHTFILPFVIKRFTSDAVRYVVLVCDYRLAIIDCITMQQFIFRKKDLIIYTSCAARICQESLEIYLSWNDQDFFTYEICKAVLPLNILIAPSASMERELTSVEAPDDSSISQAAHELENININASASFTVHTLVALPRAPETLPVDVSLREVLQANGNNTVPSDPGYQTLGSNPSM